MAIHGSVPEPLPVQNCLAIAGALLSPVLIGGGALRSNVKQKLKIGRMNM